MATVSLDERRRQAAELVAEISGNKAENAIASETVKRLTVHEPEPTADDFSHNGVKDRNALSNDFRLFPFKVFFRNVLFDVLFE